VNRLLDEHERKRAMNKAKAKDDMFHPHDMNTSMRQFTTLESGLATFKGQLEQLGDLYDVEEKEHEEFGLGSHKKAHSYSVPTAKEWEKINSFWMELNVRFGSLANAFKEFDLNGNGDLSCIEFTQSCETLKVGGDDYHWQVKLFHLLDGDGSGSIGADEFMGSRLLLPDSDEGKAEIKRRKERKLTVGEKLEKKRASARASRSSRDPAASDSSFEGDPADPEFFWAFLRQFFPDQAGPGGSYLRAFRKIDTNRNANLSQSEFVQGMQMIKYPGTRSQWKKLFFELDDDEDGSVKLGEFSNWEAPGSITPFDREDEALLAGKRYQARLKEEMEKSKLKEFILDSAQHSTIERTRGLTPYDKKEEKDRFMESSKSSDLLLSGWKRTYGQVMKLTRKDHCQAVRDGLARMAEARVEEAERVHKGSRRPLSPGRNKPPAMGALRKLPGRESFPFHQPHYQLNLPITTNLEELVDDDPKVWRRREYD
jgi:Ca2+-binding EF-hand superfamily protein